MPPVLEALAQRVVRSGQLRISADHARNFVRHGTADTDQTFTARELTDPALLPRTRQILARHVPPAAGAQGIEDLLERLLRDLKKARGIEAEKEAQVARVLVQATHPAVIVLALQEGTALYVSYAHTVAELLAVHEWDNYTGTGGLQFTSAEATAVYVSCAGDPFFEGEEKTYTTDGFPALARMMVIGGQELGHFADLYRAEGRVLGRYSTDNRAAGLRADPTVKQARRSDIARIAQLAQRTAQAGLARLLRAEQAVAFYDKRMRYTPAWWWRQALRGLCWWQFYQRCRALGIALRFTTYPAMRHGTAWQMFLADMAFNLAPESDAYRHPDPEAEEAIACIEALARVPQQVHKWGEEAVRFGWPQLEGFYTTHVLAGCIAAAKWQGVAVAPFTLWQRVRITLTRLRQPKPGYYPE